MRWLLYLTLWATFFDQMGQLPVLAPLAADLGASAAMVGLITAAYSVTNLMGNALVGRGIDRFGRWPFLAIGPLLAAVTIAAHAGAATPAALLALRALHGLAVAVITPAAFALIGDLSNRSNRGQHMAVSGAFIALASMVAPPLTGALSDRQGPDGVFWLLAFVLAAVGFLGFSGWRRSRGLAARPREAGGPSKALSFSSSLLLAYSGAFALMFGQGVLTFALPLKAAALGYSGGLTGALFSSFALGALLLFLTPANRVTDRRGRIVPLLWGLGLISFSLLLLAGGQALFLLIAALFAYGVGFALTFQATGALVVDATNPGNRGTAFGLFYATFSLGAAVGPALTGALATAVDPFLVTTLVVAAAALMIYRLRPTAAAPPALEYPSQM